MDLLFEIYSEEIPAMLQQDAALKMTQTLLEELLKYGIKPQFEYFAGPRRIAIILSGLTTEILDPAKEIRGPKIGAPENAINGFLKKHSVSSSALKENGDYYVLYIAEVLQSTAQVLTLLLNQLLESYTWPKSMRWGQESVTWVRPIKNITAIFAGKVLDVKYGSISANNYTFGHYFMNYKKLAINSVDEYKTALLKHDVILSSDDRRLSILEQIESKKPDSITLIEDDKLLKEVVGLVEKPFVHICSIDEQFMSLPFEVLQITIRTHQKYLMFKNQGGALAPYIAIIANCNADAEMVIEGNAKVLNARLKDAEFFFNLDKERKLQDNDLSNLVFHQAIGSMQEKSDRVYEIASKISNDLKLPDEVVKSINEAALLCKKDLVSKMVIEMPELQGAMGYYYALYSGFDENVALAIKEHYKPQGPSDDLPSTIVGQIVAIADKIDSLNALFAVGIKPTSTKDPFAQRRSAIGILRIIGEYNLHIDLARYTNQEVLDFINGRKDK